MREVHVTWQYRTILFEFQKDGLLGDRYIDDEEMEKVLNEQGAMGWELVSVTPVQEGLLSFFKLAVQGRKQMVAKKTEASYPQTGKTHSRKTAAESERPFPREKTTDASREKEVKEVKQPSNGIGEIKIS